jgi:hypothetical protein
MEFNEGIIDTSNSLSWEDSVGMFFQQLEFGSTELTLESLDSPDFTEWQFDNNSATIKVEPPFEVPTPSTPEAQVLHIQPAEDCVPSLCASPQVPVPVIKQDLQINISQKKRGTGGRWELIAQNERIRVDKNKGKLVRVYVKSEKANIGEEGWTFQIYLVDKARPEIPIQQGDGFSIEPARPTKGSVDPRGKEFKLKLNKISRSQYFLVTAKRGNVQFTGTTLEFRSDDNGKVLNPKKRSRAELNGSNGLLVCRDICADNDLVNLLARSLVPVILDNFQAQLSGGNLEDNIAKRIRLAFNPTNTTNANPIMVKCE